MVEKVPAGPRAGDEGGGGPAREDGAPASRLDEAVVFGPQARFGRRTFIIGSAAALAALRGARFGGGAPAARLERLARILGSTARQEKPDLTIAAERDFDLVLLDFSFYGFEVKTTSDPPAIVPTTQSNWVVVQFPPQSIAEAAFILTKSSFLYDPPPVLSVMSGPSQLVFSLETSQSIPLPTMTVADLLDWTQWSLQVEDAAYVSSSKPPAGTSPGEFQTFIECPYGLYLSPVVFEAGYLGPYVETPAASTGDIKITIHRSVTTQFVNRIEPLLAGPLLRFSECWYTELRSTLKTVPAFPPDKPSVAVIPLVSAVWTADKGLAKGETATPDKTIAVNYAPLPPPP